MGILKILLGFMALLLGWGLLFKTGLIFRINAWLKENVFNDQMVLYSRRRLALLLFVLGVVALFSGVESVFRDAVISSENVETLIGQARGSFKLQKYERVVSICRTILRSNPRNVPARELLSNALWALGQKEEAFQEARLLQYFQPSNTTAQILLSKVPLKAAKAK
jgi:hypothetical protein